MLGWSNPYLPVAPLAATLELLRRRARERRDRMLHLGGWSPDAITRTYLASETGLTLVLEHLFAPASDDPAARIDVTDQIRLAVGVLATCIEAGTPPDQVPPQVTLVAGRRWLVAPAVATAILQTILAILSEALLDAAMMVRVALPQVADGAMIIGIDADALSVDAEPTSLRTGIAEALTPLGGCVIVQRRDRGVQITLRLPLAIAAPQGADPTAP